jgi:hypothetical protein
MSRNEFAPVSAFDILVDFLFKGTFESVSESEVSGKISFLNAGWADKGGAVCVAGILY